MRKTVRFFVVCTMIFLPAVSFAGNSFDGKWLTTLACPAKGNTEGYTWKFTSEVVSGRLRGEHGTADQPGYLLVEGPIADNGSAKLTANGIVASRKYATGVFAHQGATYSYDIKAQFKDTVGTGIKSEGLGIVGRTCTFDFVKQ